MARTLSRVLPASGRREPVRSSAAGTQAGMGGVSSTLRTPETQMFRCPRNRGNFTHRCVVRYNGEHKVKHFSCLDQFRCLAFAQLTWRESLRDIEACLNAQASKLYRLGFRAPHIARNTMSNANAVRDWRIYADFAQHLIGMARELYAGDTLPDLEGLDTVYALDSSTIDLCLSVFPWAPFRSTKAAIKL